MSKRAEERAMEVYPIREDFYRNDGIARSEPLDLNLEKRGIYKRGYEQAEKDTIERVIAWLEWHSNDYIFRDNYMGKEELNIHAKMFDDLKKAMETESYE